MAHCAQPRGHAELHNTRQPEGSRVCVAQFGRCAWVGLTHLRQEDGLVWPRVQTCGLLPRGKKGPRGHRHGTAHSWQDQDGNTHRSARSPWGTRGPWRRPSQCATACALRPRPTEQAAMSTSRVCMLTVCIRSPGMHVRMRVRSSGVHACATAGVQWPGRCMLTLRHELLVAASVQRVLPVVGLALIPAAKEKDLFYFLNSENNSWLDFGECETAWGEEGGRMPSPFFGAS